MTETATLPERSQLPEERTWDLTSVFASDDAWTSACETFEARLPALGDFRGRLGEGPEVLADFLELWSDTRQLVQHIWVYAGLSYAVDMTNQDAMAMAGRARTLYSQLEAATAFVEPELIAVGLDQVRQWVETHERLEAYAHFIRRIADKADHVRSAEVEEVVAMASDPFSTASATAGILTDADLTFTPAVDGAGEAHEVAQGSIDALVTRGDRTLRRTAWQSYADGHLEFRNTLANNLTAAIKQDVFHARVRGYSSALEAALAPHRIPTEVFHNLIDVFERNLATWHRYWRIRRHALDYEALHPWDIKAPLIAEPPTVPYEQAVQWITAGMAPLGTDYVATLRRGATDARWIDVYPNKGKRSGAFSSGAPGTHPFILMSYTDDLYSLSTLAHELGHSLHSYLTWQHQPQVYSRYSLFAAEVASNFNQALVRRHLFETQDDPDFQIALIEEAMSNFHRYFFIMPTLARFELEVHERVERGETPTAASMIALAADLFGEGYGNEVAFEREPVGITWAQFQHLYANFYVYQYATGISGAHALAAQVADGNGEAAERYLGFLRAGGARYPLDALVAAGVDLRTPEPVETAFAELAALVDRLESLIA